MPISKDDLTDLIKASFPDAHIKIQDLIKDNDHYAVEIESASFIGKNRIQQHQLVYNALQGRMGTDLHAMSLKTKVPE